MLNAPGAARRCYRNEFPRKRSLRLSRRLPVTKFKKNTVKEKRGGIKNCICAGVLQNKSDRVNT